MQLACTGPAIELDLQAPRTASSGRKLMLTNAGGSYGFRLSFAGSLFTGSFISVSAFVCIRSTLALPTYAFANYCEK